MLLELLGTIQPGLGTIAIDLAHPCSNIWTGETKMTAITYARLPLETKPKAEFPAKQQLEISSKCSREEEFQLALDRYITDYRSSRAMVAERRQSAHNTKRHFSLRFMS